MSSATNNCGRIDEGDEIVQVNYRTVVGWQLRKLVDIMKEYQTELILTLKKRPKHSISSGQVNIVKPFKLPLKEYSANQRPLPKINGSMTLKAPKPRKPLPTELYSNLDDTFINRNLDFNHIDNQFLSGSFNKGKAAIKRRATIGGSSLSVNQCGTVRVDDLLIKQQQTSDKIMSEVKQQQRKQEDNQQSNNNSVSYIAKVQPLQSVANKETTTVPKQLSTFSVNNSNGKSVATIKSTTGNDNVGIVLPTSRKSNSEQPQLKLSTFQPEVPSSLENSTESNQQSTNDKQVAPSLPTTNKPIPRSRNINSTNSSNNSSLNSSIKPPIPKTEKPAVPVRPPSLMSKSNSLNHHHQQQQQQITIKLNRFVTLKQIEDENSMFFKQNPTSQLCQLINNVNSSTNNNTIDKPLQECNSNLLSGWLFTKREHFNSLLNIKWIAKYIQLTTNYQLYAFKNEHATKADLVINLAAFKVSSVCDSTKSKDHVFKIFNKYVSFLFACETQEQMRQWIETLKQLVSNCATTKPELMSLSTNPDIACYSETEDEEDVMDDEIMLQNFANELVETNNQQQQQQENIESKLDIIKTETTDKQSDNEKIKLSSLEKETPIKVNNDESKNNYENTGDDEKHNRRMNRIMERKRQRFTSTAESYRDSSPSSTSSASSSVNTSAGKAVLSKFAEINELKERIQKQAEEKLRQRNLALASGKRMYERSASCMDPSMLANFHNKLALASNQPNTTNNTPVKSGSLLRNKSGSQQSLNASKPDQLPAKPFYMTKQNKVLPPLPPRPPKPISISVSNTTNTLTNSASKTTNNIQQQSQQINNTDNELNKRSQPLPQPRTSKNCSSADEQSADNNSLNKENINTNKPSNDSILKKTLTDQKASALVPNHNDNEYISSIIDNMFSFTEENKTEPSIISKPILQSNQQPIQQLTQQNQQQQHMLNQKSELITSVPEPANKMDFNQLNSLANDPNSMMNYKPNFNGNNNQIINNQLNQMNMINNQMNCQQINQQQQYHSMLMNNNLVHEEDDDLDDELDFDDEECLESDEEYSNEEDEFDLRASEDYNRMFDNTQKLNNTNSFNQPSNENVFGFNAGNSNHLNMNHNNQSNNGVGFCAPGPNFLSSGASAALNQHQNNNNHLRSDLGSSSNSNNYPTSSSTNSFNISPYSSISQHNTQQSNYHSSTQLENAFNNQISQLSNQFPQSCSLSNNNTNLDNEHLSDCSSGVSSQMSVNSLMSQLQEQGAAKEYLDKLLEDSPPEQHEQIKQEFRRHFETFILYNIQVNSIAFDFIA